MTSATTGAATTDIVFERDEAGLIGRVSVFIKQPGGDAPVEGGRAS